MLQTQNQTQQVRQAPTLQTLASPNSRATGYTPFIATTGGKGRACNDKPVAMTTALAWPPQARVPMNTMFLHSASGIARCPWLKGPASSALSPSSATVPMAALTFSRAWPSPVRLPHNRRHAIADNHTAPGGIGTDQNRGRDWATPTMGD